MSAALETLASADQRAAERLFAPDAEWHNTSGFPGERVLKGPQAIMTFWRTLTEDFDAQGQEIAEYAESGERAVIGLHSWGSGRASSTPIDVQWAAVFVLRDERVARVDVYGSFSSALQAASRT